MFCPLCKAEYREGIKECAECHVTLVEELLKEPEPEYTQWVTILDTGDPTLLAIMKSILDAKNIPYLVKGEDMQNLFGIGSFGSDFIPMPVKLQVQKQHARTARKLLADLEKEHSEKKEEDVE